MARFAVIYSQTAAAPTTDTLVCVTTMDNAPDDITVTNGNTLTIDANASGVFTLTGMA